MMTPYIFNDSTQNQLKDGRHIEDLLEAIKDIRKINLIPMHLGTKRLIKKNTLRGSDIFSEPMISLGNGGRVNRLEIDVGHYIGHFIWRGMSKRDVREVVVEIHIRPRKGNKDPVFYHLLASAYDIYLPELSIGTGKLVDAINNSLWLIALLWKGALESALAKNHIQRSYVKASDRLGTAKGKIHFKEQMKLPASKSHYLCCEYRKLSTDITINKTIRATYHIFCQSGFRELLKDLWQFDELLSTCGVSKGLVTENEINDIRYNKMNEAYKPLMEISSAVLRHQAATLSSTGSTSLNSYCIDMSSVWEDYLISILRRFLTNEYHVVSGNHQGTHHLLKSVKREIKDVEKSTWRIYPDILLFKKSTLVAVIDAKFKPRYKNFDSVDDTKDRLQIGCYLNHFRASDDYKVSKQLVGILIPPVTTDESSFSFTNDSNLHVALIGLDIDTNDINELRTREKKFCKKIENCVTLDLPANSFSSLS